MNKATGWLLLVGAALTAIVLFGLVFNPSDPAQPYEENMAKAGAGVAAALLVVTLFVERGLSVVNALVYGERQRAAELAFRSADPAIESTGPALMAEVLTLKERLRVVLAFVAGLFISAAGVRTLDGLLQVSEPAAGFLFHVDVVLTAALIAGGSNGLAFLIQTLKDLVTKPASGDPELLRSRLTTTG